jgi:hypothetical protein
VQDVTALRLRTVALHVSVLWTLAAAQPLLSVLANSPEFFIAHRATAVDIVLFAMAVCFAVPGAVMAMMCAIRAFETRTLRPHRVGMTCGLLHLLITWALTTAIVLVWEKKLPAVGTSTAIAAAVIIAALWSVMYARHHGARFFVTCLSPALLVIPVLFIGTGSIAKLVIPASGAVVAGTATNSRTPVVLVVFDELPLSSLLDTRERVDGVAYPNFARLAAHAHWFRNATTVAHDTQHAIPAIVSGVRPSPDRLPMASEYPGSLFTLLSRSHTLHAVETGTALCPASLCGATAKPTSRLEQVRSIGRDAVVVYLHIILPTAYTATLPPVNQSWNDFTATAGGAAAPEVFKRAFENAALGERDKVFDAFVADIGVQRDLPAFHYLHSMIVHIPWRHLPTGERYDSLPRPEGLNPNDVWENDASLVSQAYYRHQLQVGFADRLLGRLLDKLTSTGIYDDALIIVTADHGSSFRPGERRRAATATNLSDIATIPLFVKLPHQHEAAVNDRPAESIDIAPTVAAVLGVEVPWSIDGHSLYDESARISRRSLSGDGTEVFAVPASELDLLDKTFANKNALAPAAAVRARQWPGPRPDLLGHSISEAGIPVTRTSSLTVKFADNHVLQNVRLGSGFLPVYVRGSLTGAIADLQPIGVAVAVNGVIRSTSWIRRDDGSWQFTAMIPETTLNTGRNSLDLLVVPTDRSRPLIRARSEEEVAYELAGVPPRERLVDGQGHQVAVVPGERGYVDGWQGMGGLEVARGWAADPSSGRPADLVVAFVDGVFAGSASPDVQRPDVAQRFRKPALERSGFSLAVLGGEAKEETLSGIRIFAVWRDGIATELPNLTRPAAPARR